jgi:tetratricopeptide (TPR) repeat protein
MLGAVNRWIDLAKGLLAKQVQLPLINDSEIDMHPEIWEVRESGDDDSLRAAIDNVLSRDPADVAARFVALNAYYRLMSLEEPEEFTVTEGREALTRENIMRHLGYLVRLRDTAACTDAISIRWEIVNASAVKDYPRILALCDQLKDIVPDGERYYLRGRAHFLIALLPTWFTEESEDVLENWDQPLGPRPRGPRGLWQSLNASMLMTLGIGKNPGGVTLTDDGRDHLHDATKFLEKAITSEWAAPATARFMLARSYAAIGDGGNAAKHYQWMLDHDGTFFRSCEEEIRGIWGEEPATTLRTDIYGCLVNAYDDVGDAEKAIGAAKAWIEACPDQLGTFQRMAQLELKRADPVAAAECIRKEVDRNEALGEDSTISIILALGGALSASHLDDAIKDIAASRPNERALVEAIIKSYWPAFIRLTIEDQQQWVNGSWLLGTNVPHGAGLAVHCFAGIVEQHLRTRIFAPFSEHARSRPEVLAGCTDDPFSRYVKSGDKNFGLGQMFKVLDLARRPASPLVSSFADWLNRGHPWLLAGLAPLRTDRIVSFRNREDHRDVRLIEAHEAEESSRICREVLNLLLSR